MRRVDFDLFKIHRSIKRGDDTFCALGYVFDNQSHEFGGLWDEVEAKEVVAALNRHIGVQEMAG
jgi:hypothetical protein